MHHPEQVGEIKSNFLSLRKLYEEPQAFWIEQSIDASAKEPLVLDSHFAAVRFWDTAVNEYFLLLEQGDLAAAKTKLAELDADYQDHRSAFDRAVAGAEAANAQLETVSESQSFSVTTVVIAWLCVVLAMAAAGGLAVYSYIVSPINQLSDCMTALSNGDFGVDVPFLGWSNELGAVARCVETFRQSAQEREELMGEVERARADALVKKEELERLASEFLAQADTMKQTFARQAHIARQRAGRLNDTVAQSEMASKDGLAAAAMASQSVSTVADTLFYAVDTFNQGIEAFLGSISADFKERRHSVRFSVDQRLSGFAGGSNFSASLNGISVAGARITADRQFQVGDRVSLMLSDQIVPGKVIWANGKAAGLRFDAELARIKVDLRVNDTVGVRIAA